MRRCSRSRVLTALAVALVALAPAGCGDVTGAPDGATITIDPSEVAWTIPTGGLPGESTIQVFTITVRDGEGRPLNDVPVFLTLSLAPTVATAGITATAFLDDSCTDPAVCIASGQVLATPEIRRVTDDRGMVRQKVLVTFSSEYQDKLEVRSGSAFASASIEVTEE
ncbi:MAG TPA: hypothetical protein VNM66_09430 [Thermodesulfobacteriota bacterium]|nr:hypothetical protein [Thermodesulfobacteriota bacterium]